MGKDRIIMSFPLLLLTRNFLATSAYIMTRPSSLGTIIVAPTQCPFLPCSHFLYVQMEIVIPLHLLYSTIQCIQLSQQPDVKAVFITIRRPSSRSLYDCIISVSPPALRQSVPPAPCHFLSVLVTPGQPGRESIGPPPAARIPWY